MGRKKVPITLPSVDDLFTSQGERDGSATGDVSDIPLAAIDPFPGYPFQVRDDEEIEWLAESVAENGVLVPLMVRAAGPERYELVSGHRRKRAAELAGMESVPRIVRAMSDDEAVIAMVDSNLQRETILPSDAAASWAVSDGQRDSQGQGLLHLRGEHHILRPRPLCEGQGDLLPDTLP